MHWFLEFASGVPHMRRFHVTTSPLLSPTALRAWRICVAAALSLYSTAMVVALCAGYVRLLLYYTDLTAFALTAYFLFAAVFLSSSDDDVAACRRADQRFELADPLSASADTSQHQRLHKFAAIFLQFSFINSTGVGLVFWTLIYPTLDKWTIFYVPPHTITVLLITLELVFTHAHLRLLHLAWPALSVALYTMCLAWPYYFETGKWIYPTLNWHTMPQAPVWYITTAVLFVLPFFIGSGLCIQRDYLVEALGKRSRTAL